MAVPRVGAVGGRDGGQPVTGDARGSARAAARRAPPGAKAELPVWLRRGSCGRLAPAPPSATPVVASPVRAPISREINAPLGARRARRAFKDVGESCNRIRATSIVSSVIFGHSCTSGRYWHVPTIAPKFGNSCLQVPPDG
jgi:hypothetical protein